MYARNASRRTGKIAIGVTLMLIGVILLLQQFGSFFPTWLISWPVLLIVIGAVLGAASGFKHPMWVVLVVVGSVFLLDRLFPGVGILRFAIPVAVIGLGIWLIVGRPPRWKSGEVPPWMEHSPGDHSRTGFRTTAAGEGQSESVEAITVFGGCKRTVFSKHFAGGEVVAFMGGIELNLSQADIQGRVKLEITQVLGGTKLIVPAHWNVISEMVAVLGGIEDKRVQIPGATSSDKVLVIEGTSVLGGIEINSYA